MIIKNFQLLQQVNKLYQMAKLFEMANMLDNKTALENYLSELDITIENIEKVIEDVYNNLYQLEFKKEV